MDDVIHSIREGSTLKIKLWLDKVENDPNKM